MNRTFERVIDMRPKAERLAAALAELREAIQLYGDEYPDASCRAARRHQVPYDDLQAAYDAGDTGES